MGVPVFFKWMCMRNPKILRDAVECKPQDIDSANPLIDNFYVDMNGLIHPSVNPRGQNIKQPKNFEEQCQNIFDYIDKIVNIVRPRKLIYLAIDGVAPRAKMNQQRSRRFRAAMEGVELQNKKFELLSQYKKKFIDTQEIEDYVNKKSFDSNLITPGTTFLSSVSQAIRDYIRMRIQSHRLWKNLTVVFSDASCPGEGEHKIMEFIRQERASAGYDPNQSHCIYGADADLIMLGLATHEPRFFIIREVVVTANDKFCTSCGKKGHYFIDCKPAGSIEQEQVIQEQQNADSIGVQFQFLNLKLVREFLHLTFMRANVPFGYNLERIIDDFVFLCFFVGNDFLPHIPCLTIREGGIDILMRVYEYCLSIMQTYITCEGDVNFNSLKIFVNEMKMYERDIISEIISKESQAKQREQLEKQRQQASKQGIPRPYQNRQPIVDPTDPLGCFKEEIRRFTASENNLENYSVFSHELYSYKEKYYKEKFRIQPQEFINLRRNISVAYVQALSWINQYYYKGVASWSWFYPFHYSPFFSDIDVDEEPAFEKGEPFRPFEQLMAVLPPKTCHALPKCLHHLMLERSSPIADFFPSQFEIDLIGKKFAWLGEVLLPFIDQNRLLKAMGDYLSQLNEDQSTRNRQGEVNVYVGKYSPLGRKLLLKQAERHISMVYNQYYLEGQLNFLKVSGDVSEWTFKQPEGRRHDITLKKGIEFSVLEELNDEFVRRMDKKSYGGERFVRVIERSLGKRVHELHRDDPNRNRFRDNRRENNLQRERSRDQEDRRNRGREERDDKGDRKDKGYRGNKDDRNDRRGDLEYKRQSSDDRRSRDNRNSRDDRDTRRRNEDNSRDDRDKRYN